MDRAADAATTHEALGAWLELRREIAARLPGKVWAILEATDDGGSYRSTQGLTVIASVACEQDGRLWAHVSASRKSRVPDYADMCLVKRMFLGPERTAYQVHVPESRHVNLTATVLHLWCPLDGDVLPDFTSGTGSI